MGAGMVRRAPPAVRARLSSVRSGKTASAAGRRNPVLVTKKSSNRLSCHPGHVSSPPDSTCNTFVRSALRFFCPAAIQQRENSIYGFQWTFRIAPPGCTSVAFSDPARSESLRACSIQISLTIRLVVTPSTSPSSIRLEASVMPACRMSLSLLHANGAQPTGDAFDEPKIIGFHWGSLAGHSHSLRGIKIRCGIRLLLDREIDLPQKVYAPFPAANPGTSTPCIDFFQTRVGSGADEPIARSEVAFALHARGIQRPHSGFLGPKRDPVCKAGMS